MARRERADAVIAGRAAMYRDKAADRDEVAATAHVMRRRVEEFVAELDASVAPAR